MSSVRKVTVPQFSEGVDSGTLVAWLKAVGDSIEPGEAIAEIMSDKVNVEIESPYRGVIQKLLANEDDDVAVGQEIAVMECDEE